MERSIIDMTSGGALVNKTPLVVKAFIANIAANSQKFSNKLDLLL